MQDGFELYLHGFIVADDGRWVVVQQGMNGALKQARRYHWLSEGLTSFVEAPHAAIDGPRQGTIVNLTDRRAAASRTGQVELLRSLGPDRIAREAAALAARPAAPAPSQPLLPHLVMPAHHDVRPGDVVERRLHATLVAAAERGPADFAGLLMTPGVGARTVRSLAMVAEVVHGAPYRFGDPARFSLAHGGKDGHPFPVPLRVYDETIRVLKSAVAKAKLGREEELGALKRLDDAARRSSASRTDRRSRRSSTRSAGSRPPTTAARSSARRNRSKRRRRGLPLPTTRDGGRRPELRSYPTFAIGTTLCRVLSAFSKKRRMLRAAWRMRCSFSTRAMRT